MDTYKVIDINTWIRRDQFAWFNSFENPTYGFNVKIDVTEIVKYSKRTKTSFFANFFYCVMLANNNCEPMRLRYYHGEVRLYDEIIADFTVKTEDGSFNNAAFDYTADYKEFYKRCRATVEKNNKVKNQTKNYNSGASYNRVYSSCLTSLCIDSMTHPIIYRDRESLSVPHIFWSKYRQEGDRFYLFLNTTVSHALVDGEHLSEYFNLVIKYAAEFENLVK